MHSKKTAFVVEHDFIMATYLADRCVGWLVGWLEWDGWMVAGLLVVA